MHFSQLFYISLLILSASCSTGPDFERQNKHDPKSDLFRPAILGFQVELNEDKTVTLDWYDFSDFENGVVIAKKLGVDGNFSILDTLPEGSLRYTDSSKLLDNPTTYYVGAFRNGTTPLDSSEYISKKLSFGKIEAIQTSANGNEITLSWDDSIPYTDQFLVVKNQTPTSSTVIDTIDGKTSEFTFISEDEAYFMDITLEALILNQNGKLVSIAQKEKNKVAFNYPKISEFKLLNEATIELSFEDKSSFEDKFIVYERNRSRNSQQYPDFTAIDTLPTSGEVMISKNNTYYRDYIIKAYSDIKDIESAASDTITINFTSLSPSQLSITDQTQNSVAISWEDGNKYNLRNDMTYHFELKLYDAESEELVQEAVLPASQTFYTFENLSPSTHYKFTVNTYSTDSNIFHEFLQAPTIQESSQFYLAGNNISASHTKIFPDLNKIVYASGYQSPGLIVYDLNTNNTSYIYDTNDNQNDYPQEPIIAFKVSDDLGLAVTLRSFDDYENGLRRNLISVVDRTAGTPEFFQKQITDTLSHVTQIAGFISNSELIYTSYQDYPKVFKVYRWNFKTNQTTLIFDPGEFNFTAAYADFNNIIIARGDSFFLLNSNGSVVQTHQVSQYGFRYLNQSPTSNDFTFNFGGKIYWYNISTNNISDISDLSHIYKHIEIPQYNFIIARLNSSTHFLDLRTGDQIYRLFDSYSSIQDRFKFDFNKGIYLPARDQVLTLYGSRIKLFDVNMSWVIKN